MNILRGFRTIVVNAIMALPLLAEPVGQILNAPELRDLIPAHYLPYYGLGMVIVNMILRSITSTPIGRRA